MKSKIKKAIEGSIEKWEMVKAKKWKDRGADNCPLYELFYKDGCLGCPIYEKTGYIHCSHTPYEKWDEHQWKIHDAAGEMQCKICERHVKAELKFLKSLLDNK